MSGNDISLIIWIFLFIIPSSVGGLLMMMLSSIFFSKQEFWRQSLYPSVIAIISTGVIYPTLFFSIFKLEIRFIVIICTVYTLIAFKMFYSNDWKKYKN